MRVQDLQEPLTDFELPAPPSVDGMLPGLNGYAGSAENGSGGNSAGNGKSPASASNGSGPAAKPNSADPEPTGYTSKEVVRIIGISDRQLNYWDKIGFIKPSARQAQGSGTRRLYSYSDLLRFKLAKQLQANGVRLRTIADSFSYIEQLGDNIHTADLIIDRDKVHYARADEEILDLLHNGQGVLAFVKVERIREELDGTLLKLSADEAARTAADEIEDPDASVSV